ncbi:hypothetical protein BUY43_07580 [Staphylococcus devriesei]|uniref:DUF1440 domain-containing protein n=4 Tax=Staphylococcus TaxID=1279 RepID=A0ABX5ICA0_9STAP|nr:MULTISPECIES: DUF6789 family protein [Staphylococcus]EZW47071.1 hypothetical protein U970_02698 [Staphylococcus aureus 56824-10]MCE5008443.1 hypothetical protein [Staphylococcus equorum]MCE5037412.1 hypothetical protein [Staphylococcus haemolyticus]MCE6047679.1 hypothetical protein [Staphylococcus aureus]MDG6556402.1 hypothetical protein [Staphylococcus aureus]
MTIKRFIKGFFGGIIASIIMVIIMMIANIMNISSAPDLPPKAVIKTLIGDNIPSLIITILAMIAHMLYGGLFGGIITIIFKKVKIFHGLLSGFVLWLIMQIVVFPFIGWGIFALNITFKIAVFTLVLHLVYGLTLVLLVDRKPNINKE